MSGRAPSRSRPSLPRPWYDSHIPDVPANSTDFTIKTVPLMLFAYVLKKSPLLAPSAQVTREYNKRKKSQLLTIPLCFQTGDPL